MFQVRRSGKEVPSLLGQGQLMQVSIDCYKCPLSELLAELLLLRQFSVRSNWTQNDPGRDSDTGHSASAQAVLAATAKVSS